MLTGTAAFLILNQAANAETRVTFEQDGARHEVLGRVLVEAQDGGLLIEGKDTRIWVVQPDELKERTDDETPFAYGTRAELVTGLLREFPSSFQVHETVHYVICYNTSKAYAEWCGGLYERLYRAFQNYWERRGFQLQEPKLLVAIVFQDRDSFREYARAEMGESAQVVIGFYSLRTNRMTTFDLTGVDELRGRSRRVSTSRHVNVLLSRPEAERTVATVVHEATHQLAFNCGLHRRFADIPVWLSEGMAIFFETPDLNASKGWRTVGQVNQVRLRQFDHYLTERRPDSLNSLVTTDQRFRDPRSIESAYAESWALCHFLLKQRPKEFAEYLKTLQEKPPLGTDPPEQRLLEFQQAFGKSLSELDADLLKYIAKLP